VVGRAIRPVAIELTDELIELEQAAWTEQQENRLTVETAARVQAAITTHAEATGQGRYEVERALRRVVRHPEPDA
jgi:DNA-binding protein H-NS